MTQHQAISMVIAPEQAAKWLLADNSHNRPISNRTVCKYANDMQSGMWKLNGETIKISNSGRVLDGQHRLKACVKAGAPFVSYVVFGTDDDTFDTIDRGYSRSTGQIFALAGETNANMVAGGLRSLYNLRRGTSQTNSDISIGSLRELLAEYEDVRHWASFIKSRKMLCKLINPSVAVALGTMFGIRGGYEAAEEFFDSLHTGLAMRQPVSKLRQKLLADKFNPKRAISRDEQAAITIKAWNAVRAGKEIGNLRWTQAGESPEQMPLIS